jgi:hypothetical protein
VLELVSLLEERDNLVLEDYPRHDFRSLMSLRDVINEQHNLDGYLPCNLLHLLHQHIILLLLTLVLLRHMSLWFLRPQLPLVQLLLLAQQVRVVIAVLLYATHDILLIEYIDRCRVEVNENLKLRIDDLPLVHILHRPHELTLIHLRLRIILLILEHLLQLYLECSHRLILLHLLLLQPLQRIEQPHQVSLYLLLDVRSFLPLWLYSHIGLLQVCNYLVH